MLTKRFRALIAAAGAVAVGGSIIAVTGPANGANSTSSGVLTSWTAKPAAGVTLALCKTACFNGGAPVGAGTVDPNGAFAFKVDNDGAKYAWAISGLNRVPGYEQAAENGYLKLNNNGVWSVTKEWGQATRQPLSEAKASLELAKPIQNPKNQVTHSTPNTRTGTLCVNRATTVKATEFAGMPGNTRIAYQWYVGTNPATMKAIAGATSARFTPTSAHAGKTLSVALSVSAPARVAYDQIATIGAVGTAAKCHHAPKAMPSNWVTSFGKKAGTTKPKKTVRIKKTKVAASAKATVSYQWTLAGKKVSTKSKYRIPAKAKGKTVKVTVSVKKPGYVTKSKTFGFGKVR